MADYRKCEQLVKYINTLILTLQEQNKELNDEWKGLSVALANGAGLTPVQKLGRIGARMACSKIANLSSMLKKKAKELNKTF